jgi:ubiquinone/menaquinone biosynthesis C-methylase UbiE
MPDVYATIAEADAELQEQLAGVLELRAADPAQRAMLDEYTARLDLPDGAAVLEVGCGTGAIARRLSVLPGVVRVTGVDPSAQFIARARELAEDLPIAFAVGDGRALGLPGEVFDAVVFHTSLCHMPDCELALDEAHRVLRPGGRIAVFDGDYATTTMARNERDPLQSCAKAVLAMLVHDPWLMRRIAPLLEHHGFADADGRRRLLRPHRLRQRAGAAALSAASAASAAASTRSSPPAGPETRSEAGSPASAGPIGSATPGASR